MRIYRPQYTRKVWCVSPSSSTSFLDISLLNVTEWTTAFRLTMSEQKSSKIHFRCEGITIELDEDYFICCSLR